MNVYYIIMGMFYRNQRLNTFWGKILRATITCFYTSMCIMLTRWYGEDAVKDDFVQKYMDETEAMVGTKGVAEQVMAKFPWINGRSGAWWLVHEEAAKQYLKKFGLSAEFKEISLDELFHVVKKNVPVVIGTVLTHQGHIVCVSGAKIENSIRSWLIMDPWGEWDPAAKKYINFTNGNGYWISDDEIRPYVGNKKGQKIKAIYAV